MSPLPPSLHVGVDLVLPVEYVTKTTAILAQRRKGKTYTAAVLAEELVDAGLPFTALDPTGAWWGLRAAADGVHPGLPVTILGGDHGDIPLERTAGKIVAELVVEQPGYYILDLSGFGTHEAERQFATDFAERLYRRKGQPGGDAAMHLFVDEADLFVPQQSPSGDKRMLGAFEQLVRRGGLRGIGTTLISQRAAVVNKNVLEQLDLLIVLRTAGTNDRKAILGYVTLEGDEEQVRELRATMPKLALGEAWFWEPGAEPPLFHRSTVRERRTFNSSATPKAGETKVEPRKLAPVQIDVLKERMAATIERAEADDPKLLRRRVAELERELAARPTVDAEPIVEYRLPPGVLEALVALQVSLGEGLGALRAAADDQQAKAGALRTEVMAALAGTRQLLEAADIPAAVPRSPGTPSGAAAQPAPPRRVESGPTRPARLPAPGTAEPRRYRAGARRLLEAVAQWGRVTRRQAASIADLKRSAFNTYLGELRRDAMIEIVGDELVITEEGFLEAGTEPVPKDPASVLDYWRPRLRAGAVRMLDRIVDAGSEGVGRDHLANTVDLQRSAFNTYLGDLKRAGLVEVDGGRILLAEWLLP